MSSVKQWDQEEDVLIQELVKNFGTKQWATIATELYKRHGFKKRTGKQCRQRWHNHLDPQINKNPWTQSEEKIMFDMHKIHGNKWTIIAENLPGRTDNAIKNHFYSTIRRSLRRISKIMGSKNSTKTMRDIKPSTLSLIFSIVTGKEKNDKQINIQQNPAEYKLQNFIDQNCQDLAASILEFANYKPTKKRNKDKCKKTDTLDDNSKFQQIMQKMLTINHLYQKAKGVQRRRKKDMLIGLGKDFDIDSQSISEDLSDLSPDFVIEKCQGQIILSPRSKKQKIEMQQQKGNSQQSEVIKIQTNMTRSRRNIKSPNYYQPTSNKKKHKKCQSIMAMQEQSPIKTIKSKPKLSINIDQQKSSCLIENRTITKQSKISPQQKSPNKLYMPRTSNFTQVINYQMQLETRKNNMASSRQREQMVNQSNIHIPSLSLCQINQLPAAYPEFSIRSEEIHNTEQNYKLNHYLSPRLFFGSPRFPTPKNIFKEKAIMGNGTLFNNDEFENQIYSFKREAEINLEGHQKKNIRYNRYQSTVRFQQIQ